MAEYCLSCWNKINRTADAQDSYTLSEELYLCEGCAEWKNIVLLKRDRKRKSFFRCAGKFFRKISVLSDFLFHRTV